MSNFRFDSLLNLRRAECKQKQCVLAEIKKQSLALQEALRKLDEQNAIHQREFRVNCRNDSIDAIELQLYHENKLKWSQERQRIVELLTELQNQEDRIRNELNSALQGVKTLETLKEKDDAKKVFESKRREYRDNDELVIQKKASETQRFFPQK
ncbi:MAG: flagellar FliJ family protein [Thermoguttaceae bacterium]